MKSKKSSSNDTSSIHPYLRGIHNDPELQRSKIKRTLKNGVAVLVQVYVKNKLIWSSK